MSFYLTPVLFILVILYVAYPFLTDLAEEKRKEKKLTHRETAIQNKDDVFTTLKDIEMDYHMGKLSDEDYQMLKAEYEMQAISAIEEVDRLNKKRTSKQTS